MRGCHSPRRALRPLLSRLAMATTLGFSLAGAAHATENGTEHYPVGLLTASQSVMPEPGHLEFYNYNAIYDADRFNDGHGDKLFPNFHLNAKVEAVRFIFTWPGEWNGFTISSSTAVNLFDTKLSVDGASGHHTELADTDVAPIMLGWSNHKTLHAMVTANFWLPTGTYKVDQLGNAGLNYHAMDIEAGFTWTPTKRLEIGLDTWTGFSLESNKATHYRSGNTFDADFILGWRPLKNRHNLQIGIQGDFYRQLSNDTIDGVRVGDDGFRGRQIAIGPQIRWDFKPGEGILFKYQREMDVRNRPQGNKFWLEFCLPLARLAGR
jgi:hypothetical protein